MGKSYGFYPEPARAAFVQVSPESIDAQQTSTFIGMAPFGLEPSCLPAPMAQSHMGYQNVALRAVKTPALAVLRKRALPLQSNNRSYRWKPQPLALDVFGE